MERSTSNLGLGSMDRKALVYIATKYTSDRWGYWKLAFRMCAAFYSSTIKTNGFSLQLQDRNTSVLCVFCI